MKAGVYLDGLSSTPLAAEVLQTMLPFMRQHYGNPSSAHAHGLFLRKAIAHAREQTAKLIGASASESILFTSTATEAANLAVQGIARAHKERGRHLVIGAVEHPSIKRSAQRLLQEGFQVSELAVDSQGLYTVERLKEAMRPDTVLVALQHVNYDLGTIQPIGELAQVARERRSLFYCDGSMSVGWVPVDLQACDVDFLSFAPHRFSGPTGVGVLYCKRGISIEPLFYGGSQEYGLRPGTENVPAIVGAGRACELHACQREKVALDTSYLQSQLLCSLTQKIPHIRLNGPPLGPSRAPHHLSISIEGVEAEGLVFKLDLRGVYLHGSTGCLVKSLKAPYTLKAIGLSDELALSTILMGVGPWLTPRHISQAAEEIVHSVEKLRSMSAWWQRIRSKEIKAQTPQKWI